MNAQNTLCLIIDLQQRLIPAMSESTQLVQKCQQLLTGLNALEIPFFISEQYPKGLGQTIDEVIEITGDAPRLEKTQFSAYLPELKNYLTEKQIKNVIVIGVETHVCVLQTVADLRQKGINIYLPQECLSSRTEQNKANGLAQMQQLGATVSNIESILFTLLKDAKHPAFKTISKLIQ